MPAYNYTMSGQIPDSTSVGRAVLTAASQAAARTAIGAGTSSFDGVFASLTSKPTTLSGYGISDAQPLDADLTAIAALATTSYGRSLLTLANQAALFAALGTGTPSNTTYLRGDGTWQTVSGGGGSGDVVGPASATDNAIARFDSTTGKLIQNSTTTLSDLGVLALANTTTWAVPAADISGGGVSTIRTDMRNGVATSYPGFRICTQEIDYSGDYNTVAQIGWNIAAAGGRESNSFPQNMISLEALWPDGPNFIETHLIHVKSGGESNRVWSCVSHNDTPSIVESYFICSKFDLRYPNGGAAYQIITSDGHQWTGRTNGQGVSLDLSVASQVVLASSVNAHDIYLNTNNARVRLGAGLVDVDQRTATNPNGQMTMNCGLKLNSTYGIVGACPVKAGNISLDANYVLYTGSAGHLYVDGSNNYLIQGYATTGSMYLGLSSGSNSGSLYLQTGGANRLRVLSTGEKRFNPDGTDSAAGVIVSVWGSTSQAADLTQWKSVSGTTLYGGVNKDGFYYTQKNAAPADGDIAANQLYLWFDSTNGAAKLKIKAKSADGTVVAGEVALA